MMDYNYNNYGAGYGTGYGYPYATYGAQQYQVPVSKSSLSQEEIMTLKNLAPKSLDLQIDNTEYLKAVCNHKENGHDVVQVTNDGKAYCPICQETWNPQTYETEDVKAIVEQLVSLFQNSKMIGELPVNIVREYYTMIPLLRKFPVIFDYAQKTYERFSGQSPYYNAGDASIYAKYNALFNQGYGGYPQYGYPQPMGGIAPQYGYQQQPPIGMNTQIPQYGYPQQPPMGAPASNVNPMQAPFAPAPQYSPVATDPNAYYAQPTAAPAYQPNPNVVYAQPAHQAPAIASDGVTPIYAPQAPVTAAPTDGTVKVESHKL